jgi:TolB-like protein/Flp pilus assembly protein TadD
MLAVLPFENEGDSSNAYFAEGIADEIRGKLAGLPALRVIATTSSNQYRNTTKSPEQISHELGAQYLLTGSVAWARDADGTRRVRVSPELVEIATSGPPETRWHQSFDTTLANVFAVQASVATQVADRLGVVLSPSAQNELAAHPTQNLAAYDAYLRSIALSDLDLATVRRALTAAEQAVALDPGFAAAWARIGLLHAYIYSAGATVAEDSVASARAVERAIALAPTGAEGYVARGVYEDVVQRNPSAALAAYRMAVRFAPSSANALLFLALPEDDVGQTDSALAHFRRAAALDPRSAYAAASLGEHFLRLRRYPDAHGEFRRGLSLEPGALFLISDEVAAYLGQGDLQGAREALRNVPPTLDRSALVAWIAGFAYPFNLYWVLDSADRTLLMTLPVTTFDNIGGVWARVHAEVYRLEGNAFRARAWADTSRRAFQAQLRSGPYDYGAHTMLGHMLAYLGQRAAAVQEVQKAAALIPLPQPLTTQYLARIYAALGDTAHAIDALEQLLKMPWPVSAAWLRIDPEFASLRGNPRFERLIADTATAHTR